MANDKMPDLNQFYSHFQDLNTDNSTNKYKILEEKDISHLNFELNKPISSLEVHSTIKNLKNH